MISLAVTASIVLLTAGDGPQATASDKPWMEQVTVTVGPPVVVAQAVETGLVWGVWQFPTISRPEPGKLLVAFNMNEDRPYDNPADLKPPGRYASVDGGMSWQPCDLEPGFTSLYGPVKLCHRRNGDVLYSSAKSGLMVRHAGTGQWHSVPFTVEDAITGVANAGQKHPSLSLYALGQIVELPDDSLLGVRMTRLQGRGSGPRPKWGTYCLRSVDDGRTWKSHAVIAQDDANQPLNGYCEPSVEVMPDGSLLAALRTEGGMEADQKTGVLYLAQSCDGGLTWSTPRAVNPFGVFPQLLRLDNNIVVLAFGRPGVNLLFNVDGRGERWQGLTLLVNEGQRFTHTSGYTSLVATGADRFLIAYDQFDYPDADGEPRKTILVREVVVR
ncbi:MAG: exo-alpha-sialidase [Planctomycetaceae bacterium]|nr:exo-alpha-sialidase [Planctomycetaceae bacterium]